MDVVISAGCDSLLVGNERPHHTTWMEIVRATYERSVPRDASDLTDPQWSLSEPERPMSKRRGRRRTTDPREVVNALLSVATTCCQWRMLSRDCPVGWTVQDDFYPLATRRAR